MGLILAAGTGTRMESTTPKCLLNLDGTSIIEYQLECFKEFGINDIVVVVGFNSSMIKERIGSDVKLIIWILKQQIIFIQCRQLAVR